MPLGFYNVINGGKHADSGIDTQEFLIAPVGGKTFRDGFEMIANTYHTLKKLLKDKNLETSIGDEGGFAPRLGSTTAALDLLIEAIKKAGYEPGKDIAIALDSASSEFFKDGRYHFEGKVLTSDDMVEMYKELVAKYPIISIEDGMGEHDWDGFLKLTEAIGDKVQLVGDDIFVTNPKIFKEGIEKGIGNAILIKLNQIGTLTETIQTVTLARKNGYNTMISHRSNETGNTFIA